MNFDKILSRLLPGKSYTLAKKREIKQCAENLRRLIVELATTLNGIHLRLFKESNTAFTEIYINAQEIENAMNTVAESKMLVKEKDLILKVFVKNVSDVFRDLVERASKIEDKMLDEEKKKTKEIEEEVHKIEEEVHKIEETDETLVEEESESYNELKSKIRELEEDSDLEKVKKLSSNSDVKSKQKVWHYMKYKCDSLRTAIPTERYDNCDFWGLDFLEPTFDEDVKFIEDKLGHDFFVASLFCDQGSINDQGASQSSQSNLPAPQLYSGCSIASSLLRGSLGPVSQSENKYYGITSAHLISGKNDKVFNYPEKTEVGEVHEHCKEHDFASFKIDDCYTSFDDIKSLQVFETFEELESALKGGISLIRCSKDGELVLKVGENVKDKVVRLSKLEEFGVLGNEGLNRVLVIKLPLLDEFVTQSGCSGELLTMNEHFISLHKGMFPDLIDLEKRIKEVKDEAKKKNHEKNFQKIKQGELPISLISVPGVVIQNKLSGHNFYKIKKPTPLTK